MNAAIGNAIASAISGTITTKINTAISTAISGTIATNIANAIAAAVTNLTTGQALDKNSTVFGMVSGQQLAAAISAGASAQPHAIFEYRVSDGTNVSVLPANQDRTLVLNTTVLNNLPGVYISGNQINGFTAGTYYIEGESVILPSGSGASQAWIHNVTQNTKALGGTRLESGGIAVTSAMAGEITFSGAGTLQLRARSKGNFRNGSPAAYGFGLMAVNNRVKIWKV